MTKNDVKESLLEINNDKMPKFTTLTNQDFAFLLMEVSKTLSLESDYILDETNDCIQAVIYRSVPCDTFLGGVTTLQIIFDYGIPTHKMTSFDSFYNELEKLENDAVKLSKALIINI